MRSLRILILASFTSLVAGCASVPNTFVATERQEYNAVSPYLNAYAAEHPDKAPAINDNLSSWNSKLTKAESAYGTTAVAPPATQP